MLARSSLLLVVEEKRRRDERVVVDTRRQTILFSNSTRLSRQITLWSNTMHNTVGGDRYPFTYHLRQRRNDTILHVYIAWAEGLFTRE